MLPDSQPNQNIYKSFEEFVNSIKLDNWVIFYIFLELNLIKDLGYDPNLERFKNDTSETDFQKIKIDTFDFRNKFFSARRALSLKHDDYGRNISIIMLY